LGESASTVENFKNQFGLRYQLLLDSQRKVWRQYGMGYIPHNVVISPDWVVRYTYFGYEKSALIQTIETWLPQTSVKGGEPSAGPKEFTLSAAYPNPFVPGESASEVQVYLRVPGSKKVEVAVFDLRGRMVRTLFRGPVHSGGMTLAWNGKDQNGNLVPAGVYVIRAVASGTVRAKRVVIFR